MRRAVIVAPVRTPVGAFGKSYRDVPVEALARTVVHEVLRRTDLDPNRIDDVVFAQSYANSETPCIGRWIALDAGLPESIPGMQLDRRCAGGLQAVVTAAMMVQTGSCEVVLAGGVESMSRIEHYSQDVRWGRRSGAVLMHDRLDRGRARSQPEWRYGEIPGMVETAESIATKYGITRQASDEFALRSQLLAHAAWEGGRFQQETVVVASVGDGRPALERDEGIRPETSLGSLARLQPVRAGGTVTAGNASQQNDAAAACLVVAEEVASEMGLTPLAALRDWTAVGCDPGLMGMGPVPAVAKLFQRTGIGFGDLDLVEINEAFACQVLGVLGEWPDLDRSLVNVNGSGISIGHPIGATGVRILATMLYELQRRKGRYAMETMCVGGGQGMAALFERL